MQTFKAPVDGWYLVQLWGAKGTGETPKCASGGYAEAQIKLDRGQSIYVYVGSFGPDYNGGAPWAGMEGWGSGSGGGATDIRPVSGNWYDNLEKRFMVAGGGGGGGYTGGGAAGGGINGKSSPLGRGATQTSGSRFGRAHTLWGGGGQGGGGWYGGYGSSGKTTGDDYGGGGGSGYVRGMTGCDNTYKSVQLWPDGTEPEIRNPRLIAGDEVMPLKDGGEGINTYNYGYARFIFLSKP